VFVFIVNGMTLSSLIGWLVGTSDLLSLASVLDARAANRGHSLKVKAMSSAGRPIPQVANAHGELKTGQNKPKPAIEIRAGGRPITAEADGKHSSHHSSLPFRADPSRDPEDALADLLSLIISA